MEYQSVIYKNMLVLFDLLKKVKYTNSKKQSENVRVITASREKALDDWTSNKNNSSDRSVGNVLPAITCMVESTTYNGEYKQQILHTVEIDGKSGFTPVPYNVSYRCNIFAYSYHTLFEILEQLQAMFDPSYTISIRYFQNHAPINQTFTFQPGGITVDIDFDINGERLVAFDFTITTVYFVYKPESLIPDSNLIVEFGVENGMVTLLYNKQFDN